MERAQAFQLSPETPWQAGVSRSESSAQSRDLGSSVGFATKCCEHGQASPVVGCGDSKTFEGCLIKHLLELWVCHRDDEFGALLQRATIEVHSTVFCDEPVDVVACGDST